MERNHLAFEDVEYTLDDLIIKAGFVAIFHHEGFILYGKLFMITQHG